MRAKIPPTMSPKDRNCFVSLIRTTLIEGKFLTPVGILSQRLLVEFVEYVVAQHESVDLRAHEAPIGVLGCTDNRFATHIERGVDQQAIPGSGLKGLEELIVARVGVGVDSLNPRRVIDMRHRRNIRAR